MPLNDAQVRNAKAKDKPYKLSDMNGLYVLVSTTGARLWRYKYRLAGKEGVFAIGEYPEVSLAEARAEHGKARDLVKQGIHPLHQRRQEELQRVTEAGNTFKAISKDWIAQNRERWSPNYLRQIERVMDSDVYPKIGTLPIKQVTSAHILKIIKTAEAR